MEDLAADGEVWAPVDHLCRICRGRLLTREMKQNINEFRCSKCDNRVNAALVEEVCWCGKVDGERGKVYKCVNNPYQSPETPGTILVEETQNES